MIRVLLAEDHVMVRAGLQALLERAKDIKVIGEASNGQEAIDLTIAHKPDVLVLDIMMPRLNGIQAAEQIRNLKLGVKILFVSMYSDAGLVRQALQTGAKGYVLKTSAGEELLQAIRAVAKGETYLGETISSMTMENSFHQNMKQVDNPLELLSPREKEILQLIAEEHTSSEVANILSISEKTVEKHRANMMEKLQVRNLAGLVRLAIKHGLIDKNQ
ncbi:MAG: response regulator transcription factor [Anaerolineales bacterium]|nr:response regulator transcription factor [Anaerolineales bacterium]